MVEEKPGLQAALGHQPPSDDLQEPSTPFMIFGKLAIDGFSYK